MIEKTYTLTLTQDQIEELVDGYQCGVAEWGHKSYDVDYVVHKQLLDQSEDEWIRKSYLFPSEPKEPKPYEPMTKEQEKRIEFLANAYGVYLTKDGIEEILTVYTAAVATGTKLTGFFLIERLRESFPDDQWIKERFGE